MRRGIIGAIAVAAIAVAIVTFGQSQQAGPPQVELNLDEAKEEASGFLDQTQQLVSEIVEQADTTTEQPAEPFEPSLAQQTEAAEEFSSEITKTAVGTLEAAEEAVAQGIAEEAAEETEGALEAAVESFPEL